VTHRLPIAASILLTWLVFLPTLIGQPKKDSPRVAVTIPLGVFPGSKTHLTIRGYKLDQATAVRFQDSMVSAKILNKGKVAIPENHPAPAGDTQVVVELTVPAKLQQCNLKFVVATPTGETAAHTLLVETAIAVIAEKEPNNGFRQAQKIRLPQVVDGLIAQPRDVDVYAFSGRAGQKVVCEVLAARYGSALDSVLTLYDARGHELATNDDTDGSTDSRLAFTLPRTGTCFLSVIDAHDTGGPAHVYRLVVKLHR
jgi:hypothetical protein